MSGTAKPAHRQGGLTLQELLRLKGLSPKQHQPGGSHWVAPDAGARMLARLASTTAYDHPAVSLMAQRAALFELSMSKIEDRYIRMGSIYYWMFCCKLRTKRYTHQNSSIHQHCRMN